VYAKSHDDPLAADGATSTGIPPRTKLKTHTEHEMQHASGQSDIEIYIFGMHLKYIPSTTTIHWLWAELDAGEFPKMRNGN
jgi:hypothetical protein